jgi:peptidoglycan hydrolase-like protein with peptidoglycan-binding domain
MISSTALMKKYILWFVALVCTFMSFVVQADILTFDKVSFIRENNGGAASTYSQLLFKVDYPVIGTNKYLNRNSIMFTFDTDKNLNRVRTDIRFKKDWLKPRKFKSSNNKYNDFYIGSHNLNRNHISDLDTLNQEEKTVLAWMIVNSDELINYALESKKYIPSGSRAYWERVAKGQKFEKNVRKYIGPEVRSKIKEYENFNHSKLILKRTIQPKLKLLNFYSGAIDGIGGPKTTAAIKAFEKTNGLLVDGKLFGKERALLVSLAEQKSPSKKKYINKSSNSTVEAQEAVIKTYKKRISSLVKENMQLKSKVHSSQKSDVTWDNDLKNTVKGQRNIILSMRKRISSLIKERNRLRDNDNGLISTDPVKYRDIVNTTNNQRNTIEILRKRISLLTKERNTLRSEKYIASNKSSNLKKSEASITQLESELAVKKNSIKVFRNKFAELQRENINLQASLDESKEADSKAKVKIESLGRDLNLALARVATKQRKLAAEQTKKVAEEQKKIAELQQENNKLQESLNSSAGNSLNNKSQLTNLQEKYQNLYIKNNTIKVDFDKLDRKYKQLTSDLEVKNNKDTESLQRLNEELNLSLQKQKILAYDAISQKSDLQRELKIAQAEATELNSQMNDFSNIANANGVLKNDLSLARSQINALNDKLDAVSNSASSELSKSVSKIKALELELEKSKNKFAELEKQNNLTINGRQKGFVLSSEWDELKQWITPQQIRFCTILSDYDREKISAQESGNQLKQNLAIDNRDADIDALLLGRNSQEKGYFRNWIGTVEQVFAIYQENEDGDEELAAGVVIKTPCNSVTVGSGRVKSADDERYEGTAFPSDPIYTQLSQVSKGDPILFEGSLLTYQDTGEAKRSSKPRFFTNVDSSVNDAEAEIAKKRDKINAPDYFVKIDYLSKL